MSLPHGRLSPTLQVGHNQIMTNDDYDRGQRDGLRVALSILAAEEAKWEALLGVSRSRRTNQVREVRHQALRVAQARVGTALRRLTPKDDGTAAAEMAAALKKVGL